MKKTKQYKYPPLLLIIQILNCFAVIGGLLLSGIYIFGSDDLVLEYNLGIEPINKYAAGLCYLVIACLCGYVLYKIHKRVKYAPELFAVLIIISQIIEQVEGYFSAYYTPIHIYVIAYALEAMAVAYLLFSRRVRAYLEK